MSKRSLATIKRSITDRPNTVNVLNTFSYTMVTVTCAHPRDQYIDTRPVPHAQSTIALYTELDVDAINSRRSVVDCRPHLPCVPSPPGAVNTRPTAVAVYIAHLGNSARQRHIVIMKD